MLGQLLADLRLLRVSKPSLLQILPSKLLPYFLLWLSLAQWLLLASIRQQQLLASHLQQLFPFAQRELSVLVLDYVFT